VRRQRPLKGSGQQQSGEKKHALSDSRVVVVVVAKGTPAKASSWI
jgi:hypothetical protein